MKSASLFLGLIAGSLIASHVMAAQPIGLEAEPEEKLKSCDLYGPGFVYIPGTETCIKISGSISTTVTVPVGK
jgi:hypothetical protein